MDCREAAAGKERTGDNAQRLIWAGGQYAAAMRDGGTYERTICEE